VTTETSRVSQWIVQAMRADAQLVSWADGGIWMDQAPQGTSGKVVLAAWQGGSHRKVAMSYSIYLVRAIAQGASYDLVESAADSIDRQMTTTVPTEGLDFRDIRIARIDRDQPHQRKDDENGVPYVYLGNTYRVWFTHPL
jgi:hypothetical protein